MVQWRVARDAVLVTKKTFVEVEFTLEEAERRPHSAPPFLMRHEARPSMSSSTSCESLSWNTEHSDDDAAPDWQHLQGPPAKLEAEAPRRIQLLPYLDDFQSSNHGGTGFGSTMQDAGFVPSHSDTLQGQPAVFLCTEPRIAPQVFGARAIGLATEHDVEEVHVMDSEHREHSLSKSGNQDKQVACERQTRRNLQRQHVDSECLLRSRLSDNTSLSSHAASLRRMDRIEAQEADSLELAEHQEVQLQTQQHGFSDSTLLSLRVHTGRLRSVEQLEWQEIDSRHTDANDESMSASVVQEVEMWQGEGAMGSEDGATASGACPEISSDQEEASPGEGQKSAFTAQPCDRVPWTDETTSVVVRGIPKRSTVKQLLVSFPPDGSYDFLYLPYSQFSHRCSGFVAMNFVSPSEARLFRDRVDGQPLPRSKHPSKPLQVVPSKHQGFNTNLLLAAQSKELMHKKFLPRIFCASEEAKLVAELHPASIWQEGHEVLQLHFLTLVHRMARWQNSIDDRHKTWLHRCHR